VLGIRRGKFRLLEALIFLIVILWLVAWLFPLWNVLVSSTKTVKGYLDSRPWFFSFKANPLTQFYQNVRRGLEGSQRGNGIGPAFTNSAIYGVVAVVASILSSALAAYALVCLPVKGRFVYFIILFSGTIFPLQVYLIPLFTLFQRTGLYDTKLALLLVYTAICIPFCVFLLRNWYLDVPIEIFEATKIDGASELQTFLHVFVPLSKPPFVTLFLFQFTWVWNDFLFGITFARSRVTRPIMALLAGLQNMYSNVGIPAVLASAVVASLPTVVLLIVFRNNFFKGLAVQYGGSSK
jgi:ABC-type glycerol-3-phosphate transport system permease component